MFNIKWLSIAFGATAVLIVLTHLPPQFLPGGLNIKGLDKVVHFSAYSAITFFFLESVKFRAVPVLILTVFLGLAALGALDELTQPFFNRTADVMDFLADISGITVMVFLSHYFTWLRNKESQNRNM